MVAARLEPHYKEEAKKRQQESGGDRKSQAAKSVEADLAQPIEAPVKPRKRREQSRDQAGKAKQVIRNSQAAGVRVDDLNDCDGRTPFMDAPKVVLRLRSIYHLSEYTV